VLRASNYIPLNPLMGTLKLQSIGPLYSNTEIGTLAAWWTFTFGTAKRDLGRLRPSPVPSSLYQTSTINGQYTNVILFDVALQLPVPIKGLTELYFSRWRVSVCRRSSIVYFELVD